MQGSQMTVGRIVGLRKRLYGQGFGAPLTIVIAAETDFVGSLNEVAVTVTVLPAGIASGAK